MLAPVISALSALTTTAEAVAALVIAFVVVAESFGHVLNIIRSIGGGGKH